MCAIAAAGTPPPRALPLSCLQETHPSVLDFTNVADNCFMVRVAGVCKCAHGSAELLLLWAPHDSMRACPPLPTTLRLRCMSALPVRARAAADARAPCIPCVRL